MDSSTHSRLLQWKDNGYGNFTIRVNAVPGDGNCLIHAICSCMYLPYQMRVLDGKKVTRREIVRSFRDGLADKLVEKDKRSGRTNYSMLGLDDKSVPEYSLSSLTTLLRSNDQLNMVVMFIIEKLLNINIFILDKNTQDIYVRDGNAVKSNPCVVIMYTGNHFDAVSVEEDDTKQRSTFLKYKHPFITHLERRANRLKQRK